jgi:outer membrane protein OmpA-like peptidoglycan-associated protein
MENRKTERVLKPFIGIQGGFVFNGEFKENFGQSANLAVDPNVYSRLNSLLGFRLEDLSGIVNWNIKAYLGYLLIGAKPQYDIYLEDIPNVKMDIWGTQQEKLNGGVGFWLGYKLTDKMSVFTNFDLTFADKMFGYYVNAGLNYKIAGNIKDVKAIEEVIREKRDIEYQQYRQKVQESRDAVEQVKEAARRSKTQEIQDDARQYELDPNNYISQYESDLDIEIEIDQELTQEIKDSNVIADRDNRMSDYIDDKPQDTAISTDRKQVSEKSFRMRVAVYDPDLKEYELNAKQRQVIAQIAQDIKKYKYTRVILIANGGSKESAQDLAALRLNSIYEYLYISGLDIEKLETVDLGKEEISGIDPSSVRKDTVEIVVDYLDY